MLIGNFKFDDWIEIDDSLPLHHEVIREAQYTYRQKYSIHANAIQVDNDEVCLVKQIDEFIPLDSNGLTYGNTMGSITPECDRCFGYWEGTGCFLFYREDRDSQESYAL